MKPLRRAYVLLAVAPLLVAAAASPRIDSRAWSPAEMEVLSSLGLDQLPPVVKDPSNRFDGDPAAIALGRQLFFDKRLSRNGAVSCASCHNPATGFQDGLPVGHGVGTGRRRSMPIVDAVYSPWLFWDGRKDSMWAQALGPLEDGAEHGGTRVGYIRQLATHYATSCGALFGPLPDVSALPAEAGPLGTPEQHAAWDALDPATRTALNRAYTNMGKAIAAYERTLRHPTTRFDEYVRAVRVGDTKAAQVLTSQEVSGLRVFIGQGQCVSCHNGPLLTDQSFHNTGVPARTGQAPDRGRRAALAQVASDEFNCLGPYSDAKDGQCAELAFMPKDDPALEGAFKTPGLRGVAERAPYMHAGQLATLQDVIHHYMQAPPAAVGHTELSSRPDAHGRAPIRLSMQNVQDLTAFLATLSPSAPAGRPHP